MFVPAPQASLKQPVGGFTFDHCARNTFLEKKGFKPPKTLKTGTTIAGITFKDGVVLGADTRATEGPIICDKNCEKIHYIAPNIYCCGAGTSADTENSTALVSSQLKLHKLATGRDSRVVTAMTLLKRMLFRYQGHVSAALVLGGVDVTGGHLYSVWPHGSTDKLPYVTMGSGSLAAMAIFEDLWRPDMNEGDAMKLVHRAILAGIFNDLGSGGNVDLLVITKEGARKHRNYDTPNPRPYTRNKPHFFLPTVVFVEKITKVHVEEEAEKTAKVDGDVKPMEE